MSLAHTPAPRRSHVDSRLCWVTCVLVRGRSGPPAKQSVNGQGRGDTTSEHAGRLVGLTSPVGHGPSLCSPADARGDEGTQWRTFPRKCGNRLSGIQLRSPTRVRGGSSVRALGFHGVRQRSSHGCKPSPVTGVACVAKRWASLRPLVSLGDVRRYRVDHLCGLRSYSTLIRFGAQ